MTEAPERIQTWMQPHFSEVGSWSTTRYPEMTIEYVRADLYAALEAKLASLGPIADLLPDAVTAAEKAMVRYPQPNYVISKWAEETGEVTKDLIHVAEGRQTFEKLRGEIVQSLAMLHRLLVEGDQVHGLPPIAPALQENPQ